MEDLEELLKNHLLNVAKLNEVTSKIKDLEDIKKLHNKTYKSSYNDVISSMQLNSALGGGIGGKTNKVSSKTEKVALTYKSNAKYTNKIDKIALERDLNRYRALEIEFTAKVKKVNNLLSVLNNKERFVIEQFYMYCNKSWEYVSEMFAGKYKSAIGERQLRRYKDTGMNKMLEVLKV